MLFSNISEDDLVIGSQFEKNRIIYYEVKAVNKDFRCKRCGRYHTNVKEYITKPVKRA